MDQPEAVESHSLSRRAWIFRRQTEEQEAGKAQQVRDQLATFDSNASMSRMLQLLASAHALTQHAERVARQSIDELDVRIKEREIDRAVRLFAIERRAEMEARQEQQYQWGCGDGDEEDSPDSRPGLRWPPSGQELDDAEYEMMIDDEGAQLAELDASCTAAGAEVPRQMRRGRGDEAGQEDTATTAGNAGPSESSSALPSPHHELDHHARRGPPRNLMLSVPPSSALPSPSSSATPHPCSFSTHSGPSVNEQRVQRQIQCQAQRRVRTTAPRTVSVQTGFFAAAQFEEERLLDVVSMWRDAQERLRSIERFVYGTCAPRLADMQSLLLWVRRTHGELRREFGSALSLPGIPGLLTEEARDMREREGEIELRFVRRVLRRNELAIMSSEDGDANAKYYRTFTSIATQVKSHAKAVGCQTLVSNDGIHQLVRQQHLLLEELLAGVQRGSCGRWAPDFTPSSQTEFHTTSQLIDMMCRDVAMLHEAVSSVKQSLEAEGDTALTAATRSVASGTEHTRMTSRKTGTLPVRVLPVTQSSDSFVQAEPERVEAGTNTDLMRRATFAQLTRSNSDLDPSSPLLLSQDTQQSLTKAEVRAKMLQQEVDELRQRNTMLTLKMSSSRLVELHRQETEALQKALDAEMQARADLNETLVRARRELAEMQQRVTQGAEASSAAAERTSKEIARLQKELVAKEGQLSSLRESQRFAVSTKEADLHNVERRMSLLEEKEQQLLVLQEQAKVRVAKQTSNASVAVRPDLEDAWTTMPRVFAYDAAMQVAPPAVSVASDPIPRDTISTGCGAHIESSDESMQTEDVQGPQLAEMASQTEGMFREPRCRLGSRPAPCGSAEEEGEKKEVATGIPHAASPLSEVFTGLQSTVPMEGFGAQAVVFSEVSASHMLPPATEVDAASADQPYLLPVFVLDAQCQAGRGGLGAKDRFTQAYVPVEQATTWTGQEYTDACCMFRPTPRAELRSCSTQVAPDAVEASTQIASQHTGQRTRVTQTWHRTQARATQWDPEQARIRTATAACQAVPHKTSCCDMFAQTARAPAEPILVTAEAQTLAQPRAFDAASQTINRSGAPPPLPGRAAALPWRGALHSPGSLRFDDGDSSAAFADSLASPPPIRRSLPAFSPLLARSGAATSKESTGDDAQSSPTTPCGDIGEVVENAERFERLPTSDLERNIPSSFCAARRDLNNSVSNSASNTVGRLNLTTSNPSGIAAAHRELLRELAEAEAGGNPAVPVREMHSPSFDSTDSCRPVPEVAETQDTHHQPSVACPAPSSSRDVWETVHSPGDVPPGGCGLGDREFVVRALKPTLRQQHAKPLTQGRKRVMESAARSVVHHSKTPQPRMQASDLVLRVGEDDRAAGSGGGAHGCLSASRYSADCFLPSRARSVVKVNALAFSSDSVHEVMGETQKGPSPALVRGFVAATGGAKPKRCSIIGNCAESATFLSAGSPHEKYHSRKPRFLQPLLCKSDGAPEESAVGAAQWERAPESYQQLFFYSPSKVGVDSTH